MGCYGERGGRESPNGKVLMPRGTGKLRKREWNEERQLRGRELGEDKRSREKDREREKKESEKRES